MPAQGATYEGFSRVFRGVVIFPVSGPWERPLKAGQCHVSSFGVCAVGPRSSFSASPVTAVSSNQVTRRDDDLFVSLQFKAVW